MKREYLRYVFLGACLSLFLTLDGHAQTVTGTGIAGQASISAVRNEILLLQSTLQNQIGDLNDRLNDQSEIIERLAGHICGPGSFVSAISAAGVVTCTALDTSSPPTASPTEGDLAEVTDCSPIREGRGQRSPIAISAGVHSQVAAKRSFITGEVEAMYQCWNGSWRLLANWPSARDVVGGPQ